MTLGLMDHGRFTKMPPAKGEALLREREADSEIQKHRHLMRKEREAHMETDRGRGMENVDAPDTRND